MLTFRGGHLASTGSLDVTGLADPRSEVRITGPTSSDIVYSGPISREQAWCALAEKAGTVGVFAGVDPSMDESDVVSRLGRLAERGKLLDAVGRLER